MASNPHQKNSSVAYREAGDLLCRALVLIDTIDDTLLAAQLSHMIQLLEDRIPLRE